MSYVDPPEFYFGPPTVARLRDVFMRRASFKAYWTYRRYELQRNEARRRYADGERWDREFNARFTPEERDTLRAIMARFFR